MNHRVTGQEMTLDLQVGAPDEPSSAETMNYVFEMLGQLAEMARHAGHADVAAELQTVIERRDKSETPVQIN